jgi:hypothetical protein
MKLQVLDFVYYVAVIVNPNVNSRFITTIVSQYGALYKELPKFVLLLPVFN